VHKLGGREVIAQLANCRALIKEVRHRIMVSIGIPISLPAHRLTAWIDLSAAVVLEGRGFSRCFSLGSRKSAREIKSRKFSRQPCRDSVA
jgi:hypothetical protein